MTAKTIAVILSCLALVGLVLFIVFLTGNLIQDPSCISSVEERIVQGNSLTGVIESGETIEVSFGYYGCNQVKRGDIVLYAYAGSDNPLIKIVKAVPGDKFGFRETEGGWHILVNGNILRNSMSEPYLLDGRGHRLLALYEKDYQGVIPDQAYLLMGNQISGVMDASRYGLVHHESILGRAQVQR